MIKTYVKKKNSLFSKIIKRNSKFKNKCRKSNSLVQRNKQLEERRKTLKDELKKINNFRKILTKNSKIYARKYGEEILKNLLSLNIKSSKNNKDFIYNNKNKIKIDGRKFFSNKNNIISNKMFNTLMNNVSPKNININTNIITSFTVINDNNKRRNSYKKEDVNNYNISSNKNK